MELEQLLKFISKKSILIKNLISNNDDIFEELKKINESKLQDILNEYNILKDIGIVNKLRIELINILLDQTKNKLDFDKLIDEYKANNKKSFISYKNHFSIIYPLITNSFEIQLDEEIKKWVNQIINDLNIANKVKSHIVNFNGSRNFGSEYYWIAIYNKSEKNQSTGNQLYISFNNGNVNYGYWNESKKNELIDKHTTSIDKFDYYLFLNHVKNYIDLILNDLDIDTQKLTIIKTKKNQPLNQILYGPPGTGKTYNTINRALEIIDPNFDLSYERKELKDQFDYFVENGQIIFTTFHQSLSYEDFIEGIKPETENGNVTYNVKDGIFKKIVNNINLRKNLNDNIFSNLINDKTNFLKVSLGNSLDESDNLIYEYCINNNCIAIGWGEDIDFTDSQNEVDVKSKIIQNGIETKERDYNLIGIKCLKFWTKKGDIVFVSNGNKKIRAIGIIDGDYYYNDNSTIRFKQFRKVKWLLVDINLDVNLIYNKNFSQQTIYMLYNNEIKKSFFSSFNSIENKEIEISNYVLIIDEINRGNVSQIFGELITLIEEDKRLGAENELIVTLPSGELFGVPSNLYIIGTMNTADRSVEALDSALRRRFSFEEMMPQPELLKDNNVENINLKTLMDTINIRIEMLLDRDHLIGHSYFMDVMKDENGEKETNEEKLKINLARAFKDKIIPLLQEYFYGDYGKIGLVLGEGFVELIQKNDFKGFAGFEYEGKEDLTEKQVYRLVNINKENIISALDSLGI